MSLNINKLQDLLYENGFSCENFFTMDGTCFYIELFSIKNTFNILFYIPTKYEFKIKNEKNVYKIHSIDLDKHEHVVENYADKEDVSSEEINISEDEKVEENLEKKYKKPITLKEIHKSDNKILKEIYRQLNRLKSSVENINYKITILYKNYICSIRRDNSIDIFSIKNYKKDNKKKKLYITIDLETFYKKKDKISSEASTVRESIYKLLSKNQHTHLKIFDKLIENKKEILEIPFKTEEKLETYENLINQYSSLLQNYLKKEQEITQKIKDLDLNSNTNIQTDIDKSQQKSSLEKELDYFFKLRVDITENLIILENKKENCLLSMDNIMFDNNVMFDTIMKNFTVLKEFC
jgi:hypothetical protein